MRLADGHVFPIPITLPVDAEPTLHLDGDVALRSPKNDLLAVMTVEEIYAWDLDEVAGKVFGTRDLRHPLVAEMRRWGRLNISGRLHVLQLPPRYDFRELRLHARPRCAQRARSAPVTRTWSPFRRATRCIACTKS